METMVAQAAGIAVTCDEADATAFRRLYEEHAPFVESLLRRLAGPDVEPDDLVQDVFVIAWRKRKQLPADHLRRYLGTTAVRVYWDAARRAKVRRLFRLRSSGAHPPLDWRTPERAYEQAQASRLVYRALKGMPEKRRTTFILFELQGLPGAEIAELLGCPERTVWTRLFHARRQFVARIAALTAAGEWK